MKYTENALNIYTAKQFKGIGNAWINKNLYQVKPYEVIVELLQKSAKEEVTEELFLKIRKRYEEKFEQMQDCCDGVIALGDPHFPSCRGNVKEGDKPTVLFYKGDLSLLDKESENIAVIGVLNPDPETEQDEREVIKKLVERGSVIVSGLAQGCDSIAHQQTLLSKGFTVAILPSTLAKILPSRPETQKLAQIIVERGGLLITEYLEESKTQLEQNSRYVERDRLQAMFSDTVILSASYTPDSSDPNSPKIDSGSRHAMKKAEDYGLGRAVIYSKKYAKNPKYDLNREILAKDPKAIIIDPENISQGIEQVFNLSTNTQDSLF